jgi:hypothetical protein
VLERLLMKDINFIYLSEYAYNVCEKPYPAQKSIPEWHKNMKPYLVDEENPNGDKLLIRNSHSNATAKKCLPMLDSISSGYIIPLWADVLVTKKNNDAHITWRVDEDVFALHGSSSLEIPAPPGYSSQVFKYISHLKIKTPKGYSIMINQPNGHYDLPFYALPAIIDSDKSEIDNSFPVRIKSDFEGIIEKGTPIIQVTPFKRENWSSKFSWITPEQHRMQENKWFKSTIKNNYSKRIWSKKEYK